MIQENNSQQPKAEIPNDSADNHAKQVKKLAEIMRGNQAITPLKVSDDAAYIAAAIIYGNLLHTSEVHRHVGISLKND